MFTREWWNQAAVAIDTLATAYGIGAYGGETFPAPPGDATACQDCLDDPAVPLPVPQREEI